MKVVDSFADVDLDHSLGPFKSSPVKLSENKGLKAHTSLNKHSTFNI